MIKLQSRSLRKKLRKKQNIVKRGKHLLSGDLEITHLGQFPKIIHQIWVSPKNDQYFPGKYNTYYESWSQHNPSWHQVLWTSGEANEFVQQYYPDMKQLYDWFLLPVQRADLLRVMLLHHYGGLYADLDYECFDSLDRTLPINPEHNVLIIGSPITLYEIFQNSLMVSVPKHPFWMDVLKVIKDASYYVKNPQDCFKQGWKGCNFLRLFSSPFTKKLAHTVFTVQMTGPCTIDKAFVRASLNKMEYTKSVIQLSTDKFFTGTVAKHHHDNSWINVPEFLKEIILVGVLGLSILITIVVLITYFRIKCKYK